MELHQLPKTTVRPSKRLGRGYGSGKGGHTSSRGQKGQGARGTMANWSEGGQLPTIRRFPFIRGKSRFGSLTGQSIAVNVNRLTGFPADSVITVKALVEAKIVSPSQLAKRPIKILGQGKLAVPLVVEVPVSKKAAEKIIAAGGRINRGSSA